MEQSYSEKQAEAIRRANSPKKPSWVKFAVVTALYLLFLLWVGSWWGLLVLPFIYDLYVSRRIKWGWWR